MCPCPEYAYNHCRLIDDMIGEPVYDHFNEHENPHFVNER